MRTIESRLLDFFDRDAFEQLSTVYVKTSESKFLLFENSQKHPAYVAQLGPAEKLLDVFQTLSVLNRLIPGVVPKALFYREDPGSHALLIQEGLPGVPWFNLRSTLRGRSDWDDMVARATAALSAFKMAVASNAGWESQIDPAAELDQVAVAFKKCAPSIPDGFDTLVAEQTRQLGSLVAVQAHRQHGDFCVNNLLMADDVDAVIDLEHFGETSMPLFDEFTLLTSCLDFAPERNLEAGTTALKVIMGADDGCQQAQLNSVAPALYLYSILRWFVVSAHQGAREQRAKSYFDSVANLCTSIAAGGTLDSGTMVKSLVH